MRHSGPFLACQLESCAPRSGGALCCELEGLWASTGLAAKTTRDRPRKARWVIGRGRIGEEKGSGPCRSVVCGRGENESSVRRSTCAARCTARRLERRRV